MEYFSIFPNASAYESTNNLSTPHVSLIQNTNEVRYKPHGTAKDYLTFTAFENGTFKFTNNVQYSLNEGKTWTTLAAKTNTPTIKANEKILWKANIEAQSYNGVGTFSSTCKFSAEGNVMSLMYGDNFIGKTTLNGSDEYGGFCKLFYTNTNIVDAEYLQLPATTLKKGCYLNMFYGCTSLIGGPELPSNNLAEHCYASMFQGCTSLTKTPKLQATHAEYGCYTNMFNGCTSLREVYCITYDNVGNMGSNMCNGVAQTGTFYKYYLISTESFPIGTIPTDWTVVDIR